MLERSFLLWLHGHSAAWLDTAARSLTVLGEPMVVLLLAAALAALLAHRRRPADARLLLLAVALAEFASTLLKRLIHRPRPDFWPPLVHAQNYSFPSGHATASSALVFGVVLLAWPTRWRRPVLVAGVLYMAIIAWTRLYLGVHYPSDILAGWLLAALTVWMFYRARRHGRL